MSNYMFTSSRHASTACAGTDKFKLIEKTMKVFKSHRDAGDFDGRFIRDAVDGQ